MKPYDRINQILQMLRQARYLSVDELSQALSVSQMTIRRDLKELEQMGVIDRSHGGASLRPERGEMEWPWNVRAAEHHMAKQNIGQAAAALVCEGDVVVMDAGSTTLEVAYGLTQNRLTVASNFLPILAALADRKNVSLIGIGGTLYADNMCFVGQFALDTIHRINANVAVMGTSCLSLAKGLTNRNLAEAEVKRAMIEVAERVVLVMDSSKLGHHMLASVGPLDVLDVLVTDDGLADADRAAIEARGVEVLVVPCYGTAMAA